MSAVAVRRPRGRRRPGRARRGVEAAAAGLSVARRRRAAVTFGGQIFKQPGPGFRVTQPRGARHATFVRGRALLDAGRALRVPTCSRGRAPSRSTAPRSCSSRRAARPRAVGRGACIIAPGRARPPGRLPGLDAPGRDHRRRRPDARQDAADPPRPADRLRRQRAARARLPGPAPRLRRERRHSCSRRALALGPRDAAAPARGRARQHSPPPRGPGYRARLLRDRVPLRYRRIVVRAEGDGRVEHVVHAAVDRDWRAAARHGGDGARRHPLRRLRVLPLRRAAAARRLRTSRTTRTSAGPSSSATSGSGRPSTASRPPGTAPGSHGSYVALDEGRLAALGAALDLGALAASAAARAGGADPAPASRARRRSAGRSSRLHAVGAGIYELAAAGHDRLPLRGSDRRAPSRTVIATTADVNVVKTLTRVAMGLCQGRNCQRHVAAAIARAPRRRDRRRSPAHAACSVAAGCRSAPSQTRRSGRRVLHPCRLTPSGAVTPTPAGGWLPRGRAPARPLPASTDVLVVGGGLAGTALAYYLARARRRGRARRARRAEPRGFGHQRRQLPLPDRDSTSSPAPETANVRDRLETEVRLHAEAAEVWKTLERELDGAARHPHHRRADGRRDRRTSSGSCTRSSEIEEAGRARDVTVLEGEELRVVRALPRRRPARRHLLRPGGAREPGPRDTALRAPCGAGGRGDPHPRGRDGGRGRPGRRSAAASP